jgi:myxalamid-type polyketide synthase MxaD
VRTAHEIRGWLIARLAELTARDGKPRTGLHDGVVFRELGVDSVRAAQLIAALGTWLGREVDVTLLYDHPTVHALAEALTVAPGKTVQRERASSVGEAVAIVGIGCRFAGADGAQAYWSVLRDNVDAIGAWPAPRAQLPQARHWRSITRRDACFQQGGYLDDIDRFDARFFGISEAEATRMDPQQRLLLEVTYDALVDAAIAPSSVRGSNTGVYVGISTSDYGIDQLGRPASVDAYTGSGSAASVAANRLSYAFDLQGPSVAIDTACSSSAVAIHQACTAIRRGEVDMAIAGGVNVILSPAVTMNFVQAGVMASDARCKTFSDAADGYVRAEGVGVVVLKPLTRAIADGDRIYAVVLGGAVNHGGRTNGLLSPSGQAQARALEAALRDAGVKPRDLDYIEAHGTGTFIGDPIEVNALGRALSVGLARARKCLIGSVKTNIGHTEAAAGVAGVIKVALALYHRTIPASLHASPPNAQIQFDKLPVAVVDTNRAWPGRPGRACASVASIGFGGTNCQLVLAEPAHPAAQLRTPGAVEAAPGAAPRAETAGELPWLLPVSSATAAGLRRSVAAWAAEARSQLAAGALPGLRALVDRAARGRDHHAYRAAFCAGDAAGLVSALEAGAPTSQPSRAAGVVFAHPGQGSQWLGMARGLYASAPVFRDALTAADAAIHKVIGRSIVERLLHDDRGDYLAEIGLVQPALFALQVAFAALWRSSGIEPVAVVGHSMGEIGAAHVAGVLSLDDAARIIALRSQLMTRIRGRGMMALVELSVSEALEAIAPHDGKISIAASNSPSSTVLSGDAAAIQGVLAALEARGVFARAVKVDVASHSAQVDPILDELHELLAPIRPQPARIPMWSTVLGHWVEGPELDARYWVRNLREPVRFAEAVAALADADSVFVELSPHPVLLSPVEQCMHHAGLSGRVVASARRDRDERLCVAEALVALYQAGCRVVWPVQSAGAAPAMGWAPGYAWDDQHYWWHPPAEPAHPSEPAAATAAMTSPGRAAVAWEVPGFWDTAIEPATADRTRIWQATVHRETCGVMASHQVAGRVVLPGALFLALAVQAAAESWRVAAHEIELDGVRLVRPVVAEPAAQVQLVFDDAGGPAGPHRSALVKLFVRDGSGWALASEAVARIVAEPVDAGRLDLPRRIEALPERHADGQLYAELDRLGVTYGAHFQGVKAVWRSDGEALGLIVPTSEVAAGEACYAAHPALIDAAFHLTWAALSSGRREVHLRGAVAQVPAAIERVWIAPRGPHAGISWASVRRRADDAWDVSLLDDTGAPRVRIDGLQLASVSAASFAGAAQDDACFALEWRASPVDGARLAPAAGAWMIAGEPDDPYAQQVRAALAARGGRVRFAGGTPPGEPEHVLYVAPRSDAPADAPAEDVCGPLLALVQAFARGEQPGWQSLTIVTRCAQAVPGAAARVAHAPLWGMGRAIAAELPAWPARLIDLDDAAPAEQLVAELDAGDPEVALHAGQRWLPRLAPVPGPTGEIQLRDDASYLITGGAGGLGGVVGRRFVAAGAGCVVLCGRRAEPPPELAAWLAVEPRARYVALDVADRAAVARLVRDVQASGRPLRGVIHAAGVLQDGRLDQLTAGDFDAVMAAKRDGGVNLDLETADLRLEFFVVFSSAAALIGSPGQANYAAANAFVDQLCWARRASGKPALAINWGPWAEVGLATAEHRGPRLATLGVASISPEAGVSCLMALLARGDQGQLAVVAFDRPRLAAGPMAASPVLAEIVGPPHRPAPAPPASASSPASAPRAVASQLEAILRDHLAAVLQRPLTEVDLETPFSQLGLESLEVLRFKNRVEAALQVVLPATLVWKFPTIRALAKRLESDTGNVP